MSVHLLAFTVSVVALMLLPGPNVVLITANSLAHGVRYGLLTVAGTSCAMALQLTIAALGIGGMLAALGGVFFWLRWAGVAYLTYLGVMQWRAAIVDVCKMVAAPKSGWYIYRRAVMISLTNPKTLFFFGAFFPQFIDTSRCVMPQFTVLGGIFLMVAVVVDGGWALLADQARHVLARHGRLRNRLSGSALIGAGIGLAAARIRA